MENVINKTTIDNNNHNIQLEIHYFVNLKIASEAKYFFLI